MPNQLAPATEQEQVHVVHAGFWFRLGASALDALAIGFMVYAVDYLASLINGWMYDQGGNMLFFVWGINFITTIGVSLLPILFVAACESSSYQATPGKRALGLKVTDVEGKQVSFGRALGRRLGQLLSAILFIGYIMAAFTPKKQALHDYMASCLVIREKRVAARQASAGKQGYARNGDVKG